MKNKLFEAVVATTYSSVAAMQIGPWHLKYHEAANDGW